MSRTRTSLSPLLWAFWVETIVLVSACTPFESNRQFDTENIRRIEFIGDRVEDFSGAIGVIARPRSALVGEEPIIDDAVCSISGRDIGDVRVDVRGDIMVVDVRGSEKDATVVCTILDMVSLTAVDIDVRLSLTTGVGRIDLIDLTRSTSTVRLSQGVTFIGYSVVDSQVRVTDLTRGPAVEVSATNSWLELSRMSRLDATLVDSHLDRGAFVEEEANLDLSASVVENLCAPGVLVVRAVEGSNLTYDCDPDVLDLDVDESSDVEPAL